MERIATLGLLDKTLSQAPQRHKVIITDSNTTDCCLAHLIYNVEALSEAQIIEIEAGESSKNLETYASVIEALLEQGADKATMIIALGGGVVCDLANFVGSTFKRGVSTILIPTTTLAMVDAAIGGKCGLDIGNVKNQIGTFHQAEMICIDTSFLETLDERHIKAGAAEMLKTSLVADRALAEELLSLSPSEIGIRKDLIKRCIRLKQAVVRKDRFDKGERQILNFGHTIGHALESLAIEENRDLYHGEAVANGMYHTLNLSDTLCKYDRERIQKYIKENYPIEEISEKLPQLLNYMNADKKNTNDKYNFVLLESIGKASIGNSFNIEQIYAKFNR